MGTLWLFGYPRGFRIKGIDSSIRIRFLFIISKNYFLIKKTAFVIYQILVNSKNDANKEKESTTLRRRENLDFKSSKRKSDDFTEQNCFGLFGKIQKNSRSNMRHQSPSKERSTFSLFESRSRAWKKKKKEVESESLQKLCYEIDQMYIEQDFSFETETRDLILVGENDEDEMVTLEFIPEIEEQKLPEKPQIQSCITQFFKNNKWLAQRLKKYALIFLLKSFVYPISHIFVRPKRVWLSGYVWLSGVWLSGVTTVWCNKIQSAYKIKTSRGKQQNCRSKSAQKKGQGMYITNIGNKHLRSIKKLFSYFSPAASSQWLSY